MDGERYLAFPFAIGAGGAIASTSLEDAIRGRIEQVLFTSPGERVMQPGFGCGLRDLVFEPNNEVLAAAAEFTIARALQSQLGRLVMINAVHVAAEAEALRVEVIYTKSRDLQRERVAFHLLPQDGANRG
jgi:phage baseplate assembly protein W